MTSRARARASPAASPGSRRGRLAEGPRRGGAGCARAGAVRCGTTRRRRRRPCAPDRGSGAATGAAGPAPAHPPPRSGRAAPRRGRGRRPPRRGSRGRDEVALSVVALAHEPRCGARRACGQRGLRARRAPPFAPRDIVTAPRVPDAEGACVPRLEWVESDRQTCDRTANAPPRRRARQEDDGWRCPNARRWISTW